MYAKVSEQICSGERSYKYGAFPAKGIITVENEWALLIEANNDVEADIICGFLQDNGIPARKADSSPYTGAMRVIGGLAVEVEVYVPNPFLGQAKKLLANFEANGDKPDEED